MANFFEDLKSKLMCLSVTDFGSIGNLEFSSDLEYLPNLGRQREGSYKKLASVFLLLTRRENDYTVLFIKRSAMLKHHPGQRAFPGGSVDEQDLSILDAGYREVEEEVGIRKETIDTLGVLKPHETISGFLIFPFVGTLVSLQELKLNASEVSEAFEVPLSFLLEQKNMTVNKFEKNGSHWNYFVIPYGPHYIWGATARIIKSLQEIYHS